MPKKLTFMLRGPDGRCRTQLAGSPRAAIKKYLAENPKAPGGDWAVRERLSNDDWQDFTVR